MKKIVLIIFCVSLIACASTPKTVVVGSKKSQVRRVIGVEDIKVVDGDDVYLFYDLSNGAWLMTTRMYRPYYVKLTKGKVVSLGKTDEKGWGKKSDDVLNESQRKELKTIIYGFDPEELAEE